MNLILISLKVVEVTIQLICFIPDLLRVLLHNLIKRIESKEQLKKYVGKSDEEVERMIREECTKCNCEECQQKLRMLDFIKNLKEENPGQNEEEAEVPKPKRKKKLANCEECNSPIYDLEKGCPKCNKEI